MTNTNITLTAEQTSFLLQVISTVVSEFTILPEDRVLANEVIEILEDAENSIYTKLRSQHE